MRTPASKVVQGMVALTQLGDGDGSCCSSTSKQPPRSDARSENRLSEAAEGQGGPGLAKMPVVGVSPRDIRAYVGWLAATGKVPGRAFLHRSRMGARREGS